MGKLVRFGLFELDLRAGELRKNGVKIKLQEQPFQILAMLGKVSGKIQRITQNGAFNRFFDLTC